MSITNKAIVFLLMTFAVSWTPLILAWTQGAQDLNDGGIAPLLFLFGPAIAGVVCSLTFEKGSRVDALGMRFRPNRWWLWALLIPFGLYALTVLITATFSPYGFAGIDGAALQYGALRQEPFVDTHDALLHAAGAIGRGIIVNTILFTLSEELGWRGYLYHLWRRFGFWRSSFAIGLVWGVWHWPMIYLYGQNYPDHRALGLILMPILAVLAAIPSTLVRDRGRSVWAAGILHGTTNAAAVLAVILIQAPQFPWTAAGIGYFGALLLAALLIAWSQRRNTTPPGAASKE